MREETTGAVRPNATTAKTSRPKDELSWGQFLALRPSKAIINNVYATEDTLTEWLSPATLKFYRKHGISRVYAPGAFPL